MSGESRPDQVLVHEAARDLMHDNLPSPGDMNVYALVILCSPRARPAW